MTYTDKVARKNGEPELVRDLIKKLKDNRFFSVFWGKGSTNLELIRSSTDIFKVLAERDLFKLDESDGENLLEHFFELSRDQDLKSEVFLIITKTRGLHEKHLEYIV